MELYTAGGRRLTYICLYYLAIIPVLSLLESPLALEGLLEGLLQSLLDSLLGSLLHSLHESLLESLLRACFRASLREPPMREPRLREPHFGRSGVFHRKLLADGKL